MVSRLYVTLFTMFSATPAFAAGASGMDVATTLGSLLFVIGLILFLAWVLKRMQLPSVGNQKDLKILRQIPVGTKERVAVIQVGEEQFVVGITPHSINLISRLEKPIEPENQEASPFANQLTQLLRKDAKK